MQEIKGLAHAAMQNQMAELSDIVSIINEKDSQEAEEVLRASETKMQEREERSAQAQREAEEKMAQDARKEKELDHERAKELINIAHPKFRDELTQFAKETYKI